MLHFLLGATLLAACAAWTDLRRGVIPNALTFIAFGAALGTHFVRGTMAEGIAGGLQEAALSLAGAVVCAIVPLFMFLRGAMGAGDVKLFAAIGAALHPLAGLEAVTYSFVAASVIAPAKLAWEGTLLRTLANTVALATNPLRAKGKKKELPAAMRAWFRLGPAVLAGTAATLIVHAFEASSWRSVP
ncbi:MAG: prepilin peptidase [Labilithrix sp.]|nr:prepilin peptidase [Labilithrix sp.]